MKREFGALGRGGEVATGVVLDAASLEAVVSLVGAGRFTPVVAVVLLEEVAPAPGAAVSAAWDAALSPFAKAENLNPKSCERLDVEKRAPERRGRRAALGLGNNFSSKRLSFPPMPHPSPMPCANRASMASTRTSNTLLGSNENRPAIPRTPLAREDAEEEGSAPPMRASLSFAHPSPSSANRLYLNWVYSALVLAFTRR